MVCGIGNKGIANQKAPYGSYHTYLTIRNVAVRNPEAVPDAVQNTLRREKEPNYGL
jgi:hypothetical protein